MLKKIAIVVLVLLIALLGFAATKPDTFQVRRAETIAAPPDTIFALIDDFHRWSAWSPYEKLDPAMRRRHSGASSGKGAVYEWEGNSEVGAGRMEILEASGPIGSPFDWISSSPSRATTSPSSACGPRQTRRRSPGTCMGPILTLPK